MSLIFSDGMDSHGVTANLADTYNEVTGGVAYLSSGGRFGGGAIQVTDDFTSFSKTFVAAQDIYISASIFIDVFAGGSTVMLFNHIGDQVQIVADTFGNWGLFVGASTIRTIPISAGVWHGFSMHLRVHSTLGRWEVKVDNIVLMDFTGDTLGAGTADTMNGIAFGSGKNAVYKWDDIIISDGTGVAPFNGLLDNSRIDVIRPNAVGDKTDFTQFPASTANWDKVDEASPDDDTTYVEDAVVNDEDLYNFEPMNFTPETILGLVVKTRAKNPDGGSKDLKHLIKSNLTTEAGASILGLTNDYQVHQTLIQNDPDTAAAWIKTAVDAVQGGYRVI